MQIPGGHPQESQVHWSALKPMNPHFKEASQAVRGPHSEKTAPMHFVGTRHRSCPWDHWKVSASLSIWSFPARLL